MHTILAGSVFVAGVVLATPSVSAQEPVLIGTPEMNALRDAQRSRDPLLAAHRTTAEAMRIRTGGTQTVGPVTLFLDIEEATVSDAASTSLSAGVEHEFASRSLIAAERLRARSQLRVAEAELASAMTSRAVDLEQHTIEAAVWDRIAQRLIEEDSVLVRASATLNARFGAGTARYVDVVRMRTERLRIQSEIARALASAQAARQRATGIAGPDNEHLVDSAVASARDLPVPVLPSSDELTRISPALARAEAHVAVARADVGAARAAGARRWSVGAGIQRFDGADGITFGPLLTGRVSLPIPQRSVRSAMVSAAARDTVAATEASAAVVARLRADASAAATRFDAAHQQFAAIDERLLSAARDERESALIGYASGELSLLELLDFERALTRAEIQRLESYLEMIDVWADLWRTSAGGDREEN